ncbi:macro domain-containing protein [Sphingobacterium sp. KU25419]|nr:macro domain-containing protein [Sphingobacterium sp. KU25419]
MEIIEKGDIFSSDAQTLVNTVNCVGVMGKGLAKSFKEKYPKMYSEYTKICKQGLLDIGKLWLYKTERKWILNFPTKYDWRQPSELHYLEAGLENF